MPRPERHPQRRFERARRAPAARQEVHRRRDHQHDRHVARRLQRVHAGSVGQCRSVDQRLQARVRLLDRARRRRVARLGLGRLVARRPRRRVGQLALPARSAPPPPASTARSAFCCSLSRFFDGPFGFGLALRLRLRRRRRRRRLQLGARGRARSSRWPRTRAAAACAGAAAHRAVRSERPARLARRERALLVAHAHVLGPAADVAAQRARPRPRPCACRPRRAARGRGRRAGSRP